MPSFTGGLSELNRLRWIRRLTRMGLATGSLMLPLSVAITNAAFGLMIALSLISGDLGRGCRYLWREHRLLSLAMLFIPLLMLLSLLWSLNPVSGIEKIGHLWFWLLLPALLPMLRDRRGQTMVLASLSIGLLLHLGFCVVQATGLGHIVIASAASNPSDPAGLIGHIGFGFVYSLWAGWLFLEGMRHRGWRRWLPMAIAFWAVCWVFVVQGRGGYLVAVSIACIILWKELSHQRRMIRPGWYAFAILGMLAMGIWGPGHERIMQTWTQLQQASQGQVRHSDARIPLWIASVKAWEASPWLGYGTGSFKSVSMKMAELYPELRTAQTPTLAHPHNIYLLALVREGIPGLFALLLLLGAWIRTGIRIDWITRPEGYLIAAPALALAINGMTSSSLEEHYSGIIAILFLGCGLAMWRPLSPVDGQAADSEGPSDADAPDRRSR